MVPVLKRALQDAERVAWNGQWGTARHVGDAPLGGAGHFADFVGALTAHAETLTKEGPGICVAQFSGPHRRLSGVHSTHLVGLDIDGCTAAELADVVAQIRELGWAAVAHSTWSDDRANDVRRARFFLPLAAPCQPLHHRHVYQAIADRLELPAATDHSAGRDAARLWYGPRASRRPWIKVFPGQPLNPAPLLATIEAKQADRQKRLDAEARQSAQSIQPYRRQHTFAGSVLSKAVARIRSADQGTRHSEALRALTSLHGLAKGGIINPDRIDAAIAETWRSVVPPGRHREIEGMIRWAHANSKTWRPR